MFVFYGVSRGGAEFAERLRERVNECESDYNHVPYCAWACLEKIFRMLG